MSLTRATSQSSAGLGNSAKAHVLVLRDRLFLLGVVVFVKVVDGIPGLCDRVLLLARRLLFPLGDVGFLLLAPVTAGTAEYSLVARIEIDKQLRATVAANT